jgi:uncharacterized RDD family membrane protein YckC
VSERTYAGPIVTGEAVAVDLRTAGIGSRGIALAIDLAVMYAVLLGLALLAANVIGAADPAAGQAFIIVSIVVVFVGYPVGFETLWRGRTLGKAAMGLRVVRDDGGPIRFRHAFVRGLVGVVLDRPGISLCLLALVPMLMTERCKRLGDLAAGTFVLQDRVPTRTAPPAVMPPALAGWAASLDLTGVNDQLADELRQFLARSGQLAPWARDQMGARLLVELTQRTGPPPPGTPPWAFFSAVLAERTRRELARHAPQPTPVLPAPPASPVQPTQQPATSPAPEPAARPPDSPFAPPA